MRHDRNCPFKFRPHSPYFTPNPNPFGGRIAYQGHTPGKRAKRRNRHACPE